MNDLEIIKKVIYDVANEYNIKIDKIILFGSRARGDYREDSDYDILIITEDKLDKDLYDNLWCDIHYYLVNSLNKSVDLLIVDNQEFDKRSKSKLFVYYWAKNEGKILL
ncbi:nucleotidyltransferase [Nanobdella aerobiophila]|uniref:Nucleotidyltransferase n=1 Tax=Nanobdella aerobiophila TaxID=2586965 RepID=A0A915SEU1_9ARCH|nr:nucleotidyltransferase domain-containing protein [Nanobdella aerobiophila]BBL45240.1 nucleotidyltransferase [Nanobdella aerobiophila]